MPPKKKIPFNGDERDAEETRWLAQRVKASGDAIAELDAVRDWALKGQQLLAKALANFEPAVRALESEDHEACFAASIALMLPAMYVRGCTDPMEMVASLKNAETFIVELLKELPTTREMDGTDAVDTMLRGIRTRDESAYALKTTVDALEARRKRRR